MLDLSGTILVLKMCAKLCKQKLQIEVDVHNRNQYCANSFVCPACVHVLDIILFDLAGKQKSLYKLLNVSN